MMTFLASSDAASLANIIVMVIGLLFVPALVAYGAWKDDGTPKDQLDPANCPTGKVVTLKPPVSTRPTTSNVISDGPVLPSNVVNRGSW